MKFEVPDPSGRNREVISATVATAERHRLPSPPGARLADAGPDVQLREGETYWAAGQAVDPAPYAWSATVDYDDGSGTQTLVIVTDLSFELSHVDATRGMYTVTVTVDDAHGRTGTELIFVDVYGPTIYVDANANGGGRGTTWAEAFVHLEDALEVGRPGEEIWVADRE